MNTSVLKRPMQAETFRAMGCPINVTIVGPDSGAFRREMIDIIAAAEDWEQRFSRFRADSEISRLHARAGTGPIPVSRELFILVERAIEESERSGGAFNPLVLGALQNAGYDRDFDDVRHRATWSNGAASAVPPLESITLNRRRQTIALAESAGIDLSGIAKGAFIDAVIERYAEAWPGGCFNAGGDVRVWGLPPDGDTWTVGLEHPNWPELDIAQVRLINLDVASAVATSGRNRRKWNTAQGVAHHLIDPSTGLPVEGDVVTATAFAADTITADIAAKTLFITVSKNEEVQLGRATTGLTIDAHGLGKIWKYDGTNDIEIIPLIARVGAAG
jgi:FAD:protein FMN transferase